MKPATQVLVISADANFRQQVTDGLNAAAHKREASGDNPHGLQAVGCPCDQSALDMVLATPASGVDLQVVLIDHGPSGPEGQGAPAVILAQRIIDEAQRHGVYVAEDPQLLALLSRIDLDKEIPPELYTAVAVILSWVYWLKGMRPGDEKTP